MTNVPHYLLFRIYQLCLPSSSSFLLPPTATLPSMKPLPIGDILPYHSPPFPFSASSIAFLLPLEQTKSLFEELHSITCYIAIRHLEIGDVEELLTDILISYHPHAITNTFVVKLGISPMRVSSSSPRRTGWDWVCIQDAAPVAAQKKEHIPQTFTTRAWNSKPEIENTENEDMLFRCHPNATSNSQKRKLSEANL